METLWLGLYGWHSGGPRAQPKASTARARGQKVPLSHVTVFAVSIIFSPNGALGDRFVEIHFSNSQKGTQEGPGRPREYQKRIPRAEIVRVSIIFSPNGALELWETDGPKSAIFSAETGGPKWPVGSGRVGSGRDGNGNSQASPFQDAPRKKYAVPAHPSLRLFVTSVENSFQVLLILPNFRYWAESPWP